MRNYNIPSRLTFYFLLVITIQSYSCIGNRYNGPIVKESRNVSGFKEIEVSDGIDVFLSMGTKEKIEVEASENILENLITEVSGKTLRIYFEKSFNWNKTAVVHVSATNIKKISTSGGSDLVGENSIHARDLELKASGGSDIKLEIEVDNLEIFASGGADIVLSGSAGFIEAKTSGGSDLRAYDLHSGSAVLDASGGSDIRIYIEKEIEANASGGADISYKGNPTIIKSKTSSSADINQID